MPRQSPPQGEQDPGARLGGPKPPSHPHWGLPGRLRETAKPPRPWLQKVPREGRRADKEFIHPCVHLVHIGSWACPWLPPVPTGCPSGPIMGHLQCAGHSSAPGRSQAPPVVSSVAETLGRRLRKVAGKQVTSGGSCEQLPGGKGQGGHSREREQPHIRCRGAEVH